MLEKSFADNLESLLESFLKFLYQWGLTYWLMLRHPGRTSKALVRQCLGEKLWLAQPYTFFFVSFLVSFIMLKTFFTVLTINKRLKGDFLQVLLEEASRSSHVDPAFAMMEGLAKAIPMFGVTMLASFMLSRHLKVSSTGQALINRLFCYGIGMLWNGLIVLLCLLLILAHVPVDWRELLTSPAGNGLRALLALLGMCLLALGYRFMGHAWQQGVRMVEGTMPFYSLMACLGAYTAGVLLACGMEFLLLRVFVYR